MNSSHDKSINEQNKTIWYIKSLSPLLIDEIMAFKQRIVIHQENEENEDGNTAK